MIHWSLLLCGECAASISRLILYALLTCLHGNVFFSLPFVPTNMYSWLSKKNRIFLVILNRIKIGLEWWNFFHFYFRYFSSKIFKYASSFNLQIKTHFSTLDIPQWEQTLYEVAFEFTGKLSRRYFLTEIVNREIAAA